MKQVHREEKKEVYELLLPAFRDPQNEEDVLLEKVSNLTDFFQYYPLIVKKDRNKSTAIYYVLNANKSPDHKVNPLSSSVRN